MMHLRITDEIRERCLREAAHEAHINDRIVTSTPQTLAERGMTMLGSTRVTPRIRSYLYCDAVDACFYYAGAVPSVVVTARWTADSPDIAEGSKKLQIAAEVVRRMMTAMDKAMKAEKRPPMGGIHGGAKTEMSHPTTYAVDFDGTLCENAYPEIGAPNLPLIDKLISRRRLGAKVILWTCREGELLTRAVEFCRCYGLEFDAVNDNTEELKRAYGTNPRKIGADYYIDDKAMPPDLFVS